MKSTPSELISTFRKKIFLSSALGIILCILGLILLFFFELPGELKQSQSLLSGFCIGLAFYFWERNKIFSKLLQGLPEEVILKLETHFEKEIQRSKDYHWYKILVLAIITPIWIWLMVFRPGSVWTYLLFIFWAGVILFIFLIRWMRMREEFMLQDIKHSLREHHSEAS